MLAFLKRLFCFHHYEHEKDDLGCTIWVCRKCDVDKDK